MRKKVYISSTYRDLKSYRKAILEMFQKKGLQDEYEVIGMEGYVPEAGKRAIKVCLEDVQKVDIYILILAECYGSIVDETGKSYTETEYDMAVEMARENLNYKIFVFYSDKRTEDKDFEEAPLGVKSLPLREFYNRALGENASSIHAFTSPDNLCYQILLTFNYAFKSLRSPADYKEAMLLINRESQSYNLSKGLRDNSSSFYFLSQHDNNPVDFVERIYIREMQRAYKRCTLELAQFSTIHPEKFKDRFKALLNSSRFGGTDAYQFSKTEKLFLSIEISSQQIKCEKKMQQLHKVLVEFLPSYLLTEESYANNHVFLIFYSYSSENEKPKGLLKKVTRLLSKSSVSKSKGISKFNAFINKLVTSLRIQGCLNKIEELNDITKTDVRNWLKIYIKDRTLNQTDVEQILEFDTHRSEELKMRRVHRLLTKWIKNNLQN